MKKLIFLSILFYFCATQYLFAQAGTLDETFGYKGIQSYYSTHYFKGMAHAIAIQPDGRILLAGETSLGITDRSFALIRMNPNGSPDTSFNNGKMVSTDLGWYDVFMAMALQSDGKIVAVGESYNGTRNIAILRYNADGTPDSTFNGNGIVLAAFDTANGSANAVAVQADGKIVVGGFILYGRNDFLLLRFNSDGSPDNSFGSNGIVITPSLQYNGNILSLAIQNDGKIVASGSAFAGLQNYAALLRYNSDGSPDSTFNNNGMRIITGTGDAEGLSVKLQQDGKILMGGFESDSTNPYGFAILRFNTDGSPDSSFNSSGKVITKFGNMKDPGQSIALQQNGKIVMAGYTQTGTSSWDFALARYNPDGILDTSFSNDGKVTTKYYQKNSWFAPVAIQADGKIIAAGSVNEYGEWYFAAARYHGDSTTGTGIKNISAVLKAPIVFPNPIGGETSVSYSLGRTEEVSIQLFDIHGRHLKTFLQNEKQAAGNYAMSFAMPNLANGIYFLLLSTENERMSIKLVK